MHARTMARFTGGRPIRRLPRLLGEKVQDVPWPCMSSVSLAYLPVCPRHLPPESLTWHPDPERTNFTVQFPHRCPPYPTGELGSLSLAANPLFICVERGSSSLLADLFLGAPANERAPGPRCRPRAKPRAIGALPPSFPLRSEGGDYTRLGDLLPTFLYLTAGCAMASAYRTGPG